jgi:hypothetical protein
LSKACKGNDTLQRHQTSRTAHIVDTYGIRWCIKYVFSGEGDEQRLALYLEASDNPTWTCLACGHSNTCDEPGVFLAVGENSLHNKNSLHTCAHCKVDRPCWSIQFKASVFILHEGCNCNLGDIDNDCKALERTFEEEANNFKSERLIVRGWPSACGWADFATAEQMQAFPVAADGSVSVHAEIEVLDYCADYSTSCCRDTEHTDGHAASDTSESSTSPSDALVKAVADGDAVGVRALLTPGNGVDVNKSLIALTESNVSLLCITLAGGFRSVQGAARGGRVLDWLVSKQLVSTDGVRCARTR